MFLRDDYLIVHIQYFLHTFFNIFSSQIIPNDHIILIKIADVYETKKSRHIATYIPNLLRRKLF